MRIKVVSDLHLEFGPITIPNTTGADVLILSGDIAVADDMKSFMPTRYLDFFKQVNNDYKHVLYVLGNHEHYHGDFRYSHSVISCRLVEEGLDNIIVMDCDSVDIGHVRFIGGTLWTNFNDADPIAMHAAKSMMNDYRGVKNSYREVSFKVPLYEDGKVVGHKFKKEIAKFSPEDSIEYHRKMLKYVDFRRQDNPDNLDIVVIGHHCPSYSSISEQYVGDTLNPAYASNLSDYILDRPDIKLWTHGHVHSRFDYMIGDCRVVCNPRGYMGYENTGFDPDFTIEL